MDGQTANRILVLRNELFGEIELLQTRTQTFVAKRLTARSAAVFERANKTFPFLFSNEFPFLQEFVAQTEIFGGTYLLFKYYDYSLQNLLDSNRRSVTQLPENMLVKLLNDLFFVVQHLKAKGLAYPLIHNKTVFVTKTGNLKLVNPLLFEEGFMALESTADEGLALLQADRCYGDIGRVVLEQASFVSLFGPDVMASDYQEALQDVRKKYSYEFFNFVRKFDFMSAARAPAESRFQNVNAAENYYNVNCSNVDKYLAGVRLTALDFEIPPKAPGTVYTVKNGSIYKVPDRKNVIFDSQNQTSQVFPSAVNTSAQMLPVEAPKQRVSATMDLPPYTGPQIFGPQENQVGIVQTSGSKLNQSQQSLATGSVTMHKQPIGSLAKVQGAAQPPSLTAFNTSFSKKKADDSFFDDVFDKIGQENSIQRVSNASGIPRLSQPSNASFQQDDFFNIPTDIATANHLTGYPRAELNTSASFRAAPANPFARESSASDFRRSRSSNPVEPADGPTGDQMMRFAQASAAYIDPNESFSKRLAAFYQKEYRERNDSMRESIGSGQRQSNSAKLYGGQPKPGEKSYAVIHDFPVNT